jgi:hypothetical protein
LTRSGLPPFLIELVIEGPSRGLEAPLTVEEIYQSISFELRRDGKQKIKISPDWHLGLYRPDNKAEIVLAANIIFSISSWIGIGYPITKGFLTKNSGPIRCSGIFSELLMLGKTQAVSCSGLS